MGLSTIAHRVELTPLQAALIAALDPVCQIAGLVIICTACSEDTKWNLFSSPTWSCPCTMRTGPQDRPTIRPSGDWLLDMDRILAGTRLALRCPVRETSCLTTPLSVTPDIEGVTARCQCWQIDLKAGVYRFRKHAPQVPS